MIGEAFEITIVVSMLVLVGYPSTLMTIEALRARRRRWVRVVQSRRCPNDPPTGAEPTLRGGREYGSTGESGTGSGLRAGARLDVAHRGPGGWP